MDTIIKRNNMSIRERKMLEIAKAETETLNSYMDYIICCDHPEILDESEVEADE